MDITDSLAPASDQLDAIELISGPRTFQIESVSRGSVEQPINVHLVDFPRAWRPSKGMRRVLAACWGSDASVWTGRWVELYFDPEVMFGKDKPGGTRIRSMSHIDGARKVPLLVSRGRSATFTVQPLTANEVRAEVTLDEPAESIDVEPITEGDASDAQIRMIGALMRETGLTERDAALTFVNDVISPDTVTSRKELTKAQATRVIDALKGDSDD